MITRSDPRKYIRFEKLHRIHVKCTETKRDEDGNILECTYTAREDKHKTRKTLMSVFQKESHTNTISMYFARRGKNAEISPETFIRKWLF